MRPNTRQQPFCHATLSLSEGGGLLRQLSSVIQDCTRTQEKSGTSTYLMISGCVCVYKCVQVCTSMHKTAVNLMRPFSGTPHLLFWNRTSHWTWPPSFGKTGSQRSSRPFSLCPSTGITGISSRPNFLHVSWGQNSAPNTCAVTTTLMSSLSSP